MRRFFGEISGRRVESRRGVVVGGFQGRRELACSSK